MRSVARRLRHRLAVSLGKYSAAHVRIFKIKIVLNVWKVFEWRNTENEAIGGEDRSGGQHPTTLNRPHMQPLAISSWTYLMLFSVTVCKCFVFVVTLIYLHDFMILTTVLLSREKSLWINRDPFGPCCLDWRMHIFHASVWIISFFVYDVAMLDLGSSGRCCCCCCCCCSCNKLGSFGSMRRILTMATLCSNAW